MQFQVPQFIETEDKIVGPFTLKQFMYIGGAGGLSAILYFMLQTWLWAILSIIAFAIALSISFIKVQGRSLSNVITSAFNFYWKPQTYVWQPEHQAIRPAREEPSKKGISIEDLLSNALKAKKKSKETVAVATGDSLRKSWKDLQTGEKMSDKQFTENKMYGRYQIFQKLTGERNAARRVDYR